MPSSVTDRLVGPASRHRTRLGEWWGLVVAVAATAVIGLALPHEPDRVEVTITNPTDHRLYINSSTADDGSISYVTVVEPRSTSTSHPAIDRGDNWVLHLRTLGTPAGTMTVTRSELIDGSFTIPISINDDLAAAGVPDDLPAGEPDG